MIANVKSYPFRELVALSMAERGFPIQYIVMGLLTFMRVE
jgi:hypothetical protein